MSPETIEPAEVREPPNVEEGSVRDASHPVRRPRSRGPWVATTMAVVLLLVVVVLIHPDLHWPTGGGTVSSGGNGGSNPPSGSQDRVLLGNGSSWSVGAGDFESAWFQVGVDTEVIGTFASSIHVHAYVVSSTQFRNFSAQNTSFGSLPTGFDPQAVGSQWASGSTLHAQVYVVVPAGTYELVFANSGNTAGTQVQMTSDVILRNFDTG